MRESVVINLRGEMRKMRKFSIYAPKFPTFRLKFLLYLDFSPKFPTKFPLPAAAYLRKLSCGVFLLKSVDEQKRSSKQCLIPRKSQ